MSQNNKDNSQQMSQKKDRSPQWYQTLPGVMTATGAIITAFTGLLLALSQTGIINVRGQSTTQSNKERSSSSLSVPTKLAAAPPTLTPRPAARATLFPEAEVALGAESTIAVESAPTMLTFGGGLDDPITLAAGGEVVVGQGVYRIMAAQLERRGTDQLALSITLRLINNGSLATKLSDQSARLIVDGMPIAPEEAPDLTVKAQDSKQADFLFLLPDNSTTVELQVGQVGQQTARIPIDLTPAQP
jgi:hypothetical protein